MCTLPLTQEDTCETHTWKDLPGGDRVGWCASGCPYGAHFCFEVLISVSFKEVDKPLEVKPWDTNFEAPGCSGLREDQYGRRKSQEVITEMKCVVIFVFSNLWTSPKELSKQIQLKGEVWYAFCNGTTYEVTSNLLAEVTSPNPLFHYVDYLAENPVVGDIYIYLNSCNYWSRYETLLTKDEIGLVLISSLHLHRFLI